MKYKLTATILLCMALMLTGVLASSSGGGSSMPRMDRPTKSPQEQAADLYNRGLKARDKAWKHEAKAEEITNNEKKRQKELAKAHKQFKNAAKNYRAAIKKVRGFYQAYSSLGYALRRSAFYEQAPDQRAKGYEESLQAYDRALSLQPDYAQAIEYRGEAYLGLDRVDDAKKSYLALFRLDRGEAAKLLKAMNEWVESKRKDNSLDEATLESVAKWIAEREEISQQTGAASQGGGW